MEWRSHTFDFWWPAWQQPPFLMHMPRIPAPYKKRNRSHDNFRLIKLLLLLNMIFTPVIRASENGVKMARASRSSSFVPLHQTQQPISNDIAPILRTPLMKVVRSFFFLI